MDTVLSDLTKKTILPVSQHFVSPGTHWMTLADPKFISLTTIQVEKKIKDKKVRVFMRAMRKCNDEIYQLAKNQASLKS
jgi:hypothetical protein